MSTMGHWTPNQDDDDPRCTSCRADLDRHPHEPACPNRAPGEPTWVTFSRTRHPSGATVETQKWDGMTRSRVVAR